MQYDVVVMVTANLTSIHALILFRPVGHWRIVMGHFVGIDCRLDQPQRCQWRLFLAVPEN